MRLGLLGGTFNPIHLGHLRAAVEVREAFNLDKVFLIPSASPPHKDPQGIVNAENRLEMVRLAVQNQPALEASAVELSRPGPSYTIDTLEWFHQRFGPDCSVHFIIGFDAFSEIATWKDYQALFLSAHFVVTARSGTRLQDLQDIIDAHVSPAYKYDEAVRAFRHPDWLPISSTAVTRFDISGTQIRNCIAAGRSIAFLVPRSVADYIYGRKLYIDETD